MQNTSNVSYIFNLKSQLILLFFCIIALQSMGDELFATPASNDFENNSHSPALGDIQNTLNATTARDDLWKLEGNHNPEHFFSKSVAFSSTLVDTVKPTVVTQNLSIYLDVSGSVIVSASDVDNGSTDNSGIATITLSQTNFDCSSVGANTVWLSVTDIYGNTDSASAIITVQDNIKPTVRTQDITVSIGATGIGTVSATQIDNGSTDNCGITSKIISKSDFDCSDIGTNAVYLIVTDVNGNIDSARADITVQDITKPVVITKSITVSLNASGTGTITPAEVDNGSTDICGIATRTLSKSNFNFSNIGSSSTNLIVIDVNGNINQKSAVVTVQDLIKPTVRTRNLTVILDDNGNGSVTVAQVDNGSRDNCAIATRTLSKSNFDCSNIGTDTIWLRVTDKSGNIDSASAVITIHDETKPIVTTGSLDVYLDSNGNGNITLTEVDNGSTDNCAIATRTLSKSSFDSNDVGTNSIWLYVKDVSGNIDSASAFINVLDTIKPIIITKNLTVDLNASGSASITAAQIDNGSTDNCGIASITASKTNFQCSNVGNNTIYLIVSDVNGNMSFGSAIITVRDIAKPQVITKNLTVNLNSIGKGTVTVAQVDNGSSDNCTIATRTISKSSFDCSNIGTNTIWLRVKDVNGNIDSTTAIITVQDLIKPTVATKNVTVSLNPSGTGTITAAQIDNGSTDNCGIATRTLSKSSFNCSNVGSNTIWLRVTDVNGNLDSASAVITVQDLIKPTVITQNLTVNLDASGSVSITATQVDGGSTDNCSIATRTISKSSFNCSNIGTNTIQLRITDVNGNVDSATAVITVNELIKPTVITKNVTVNLNSSGLGTITAVQVDNGSSDNCSIATRTLSKSNFDCSNVGNTTIWLRVTDTGGNKDSASAVVTVQDLIMPTVITKNLTVSLNSSGIVTITAAQVDNGSTDNCGISSRTLSKSSFTCSNVGNNTIWLGVTDVNGNLDSASAVITVQDLVKPTVITKNVTVRLNSSGIGTITASQVDNGSTDNCGISSRTLSKSSFTCSNVGNNTIWLGVTDVSGNIDSASAIITVQDIIKPTVAAKNITVNLNSSGFGSITAAQVDNGSTDNCSIATRTLSKSSFDCSNIGTNTIWLRVTDVNGNLDSASALITVQELVKPTVVTQDLVVNLSAAGFGTLNATQVDNGSTDNCGIATRSLSKNSFDCSNVGVNTVWLRVTDISGNIDSASALITVQDVIKPAVATKNLTVSLDATGSANITASQIDNGSTDNCSIATKTVTKSSFDCTDLGDNTVYLIVIDANGNMNYDSAVITVQDAIKPKIITQNLTVSLAANGIAIITALQVDNGSSDNCGIETRTLSKSSFDCSNVGNNTIWLSGKDASGNIDSASAIITVQDLIKPTVLTQNLTIYLDETGNATIIATQVDNGSTDNCGIATRTLSKNSFNCRNIGNNTIWLSLTDVNGNIDSSTVVITVQDLIKPTVQTQNLTVYLDASGSASITAAQVDNGSTDNCGIDTATLSKSSFDCSNVGNNTIWLRVIDINGNVDSAKAEITLMDSIKPLISGTPQNIVLGYCDALLVYDMPTSSDNCNVSLRQIEGLPSGSIFPIGTTKNVFEATDASGNKFFASFEVKVIDSYLPFSLEDLTLCSNYKDIDLSKNRDSISFYGKGMIQNSKIFSPVKAGIGQHNITASFRDSLGCTTTETLSIFVVEAPKLPIIERVSSDKIYVVGDYNTHQWYRNGSLLLGETNQFYQVMELGLYSVMVENRSLCSEISNGYEFGFNLQDNNILTQTYSKVYPNPTNKLIFIELTGDEQFHDISLKNSLGVDLIKVRTDQKVYSLDLTNQTAGSYYVTISSGSFLEVITIIKN